MSVSYLHTRLAELCRAFPDVPLQALQAAMIEGIEAFSWFKDGVQYVGTIGTKRRDAIAEVMTFQELASVRK